MKNNKPKYCKSTGKYCYSSQAKAIRAKNKYEDIRRTYFCNECDSWHTTSMGTGLALKMGIIKKQKRKRKLKMSDIQKRLNHLKEKNSK